MLATPMVVLRRSLSPVMPSLFFEEEEFHYYDSCRISGRSPSKCGALLSNDTLSTLAVAVSHRWCPAVAYLGRRFFDWWGRFAHRIISAIVTLSFYWQCVVFGCFARRGRGAVAGYGERLPRPITTPLGIVTIDDPL